MRPSEPSGRCELGSELRLGSVTNPKTISILLQATFPPLFLPPMNTKNSFSSVRAFGRLHGSLIAGATCLALSFAAAPEVSASLVPNGDFEQAGGDGSWPSGWARPKAGEVSWETEEGNRFVRLRATEPKQSLMLHKVIPLPADAKAVSVSVRARVANLVTGEQAWFDARIMTDFKNTAGAKIKGAKPLVFRKDSDWVERTVSFLVPEGATVLEVMPALTQVVSGTFDFDDLTVEVVDPATVPAGK